MALPASDSFNRVNENPIAGNWSTAGWFNACQLTSNRVQGTVTGDDNACYWNADTFASNQYCQATIAASTTYMALLVRCQGNKNAYGVMVSATTFRFCRWLTGSFSYLGTGAITKASAPGDVIKFEVNDNTLTVYYNGVADPNTITDSSIASGGAPGLYLGGLSGAWDDWSGGNLVDSYSIIAGSAAHAQLADNSTFTQEHVLSTNHSFHAQQVSVLSLLLAPTSLITTPNVSSPSNVGATVRIDATASGGTAPYEYQFSIQKDSGGYSVQRAYGTTAYWDWTPTETGTYDILVDARSVGSPNTSDINNTVSGYVIIISILAANASHAHITDSGSFSQVHLMQLESCTHATSSVSPTLRQNHVIVSNAGTQAQSATATTLETELVRIVSNTVQFVEAIVGWRFLLKVVKDLQAIFHRLAPQHNITEEVTGNSITNEDDGTPITYEEAVAETNYITGRIRAVLDAFFISDLTFQNIKYVRLASDTVQLVSTVVKQKMITLIETEVEQFVEARRRVLGFLKPIADVVSVVETHSFVRQLRKLVSDTINLIETKYKLICRIRQKDESLRLVESSLRSRTMVRIKSEVASLVESILKSLALKRNVADIESVAEVSRRFRYLTRLKTETQQLVESTLRPRVLRRLKTEVLQLWETYPHKLFLRRFSDDTLSILEARHRVMRLNRILQDGTQQVVEVIQRNIKISRIIDNTLNFVDNTLHHLSLKRVSNEITLLSETRYKRGFLNRVINKTVESFESIVRKKTILQYVNEVLQLIETRLSRKVIKQVINRSVSLIETNYFVHTILKIVNYWMNHIETAHRRGALKRIKNDQVEAYESNYFKHTILRVIDNVQSLIEESLKLGTWNRIVNNSESLVEDRMTSRALRRAINHVLQIVGNTYKQLSMTRVVRDIVTHLDIISHLKSIRLSISDFISLSETREIRLMLKRIIDEAENLVEVVRKNWLYVVNNNLNLVHSSQKQLAINRYSGDLLRVSESKSTAWHYVRLIAEQVRLIDITIQSAIYIRILNAIQDIEETIKYRKAMFRVILDVVNINITSGKKFVITRVVPLVKLILCFRLTRPKFKVKNDNQPPE